MLFTCLLAALDVAAKPCPDSINISSPNVSPLVYQSDGQLQGTAFEQLTALMAKYDVNAKVNIMLWARALKQAEDGSVEGIFPALKSSEREKFLYYVENPIGQVTIVLYSSDDSPYASGKNLEVTSDNTIGTLRALEYTSLDLHGADVFEVNGFAQALEMLRLGRVDFVIAVKEITDLYIKAHHIHDLVELKTIEQRPVYFALAKNHINYAKNLRCFSFDETKSK